MKLDRNTSIFLSLTIFSILSFLAISFSVANGMFFPALDAFLHKNVSLLPSLFVIIASSLSDTFHPIIFFLLSVFIFIWLSWNKKYFSAFLIFGSVSFSILTALLIKESLSIIRPESIFFENSWSFPSVHTATASAFCFVFIFIAQYRRPQNMSRITFLLPALILLITGISRIFAGVHWFSDVFGGLFLGLFWASFTAFMLNVLKFKDYGNYS